MPVTLPYNPYDFANPVTDPESFAGRRTEKEDVRYYLKHASAARPIHLALTGERSAGKTSMLNMIAKQAGLLEFLVVRLDLNEGDAEPIQFFARLYDALLSEVVRTGGYGGRSGRTWQAYRGLVDADEPAPDLPLGFPSHLAAAMRGTRRLSIALLTEDLGDIQRESKRKVVIIIDECDVLSASRTTLQILRNLFTDLDRFMFVIAGTPQLFPIIDEVFSPIARQFKKLAISPFADSDETRDCISQPVEKIGLELDEIFLDWPYVAEEVHRITGGRPYEIQLLCHAMFRRLQDGQEDAMALNLEALDAVRKDLENHQGHNIGRKSHLYSDLTKRQLRALGMLREVSDSSVSSALLIHALSKTSWTMTEETLREELDELVSTSVLDLEGGRYSLSGDQFDEVYLRYLAASRDVYIPAFPATPARLVEIRLRGAMTVLSPYQRRSAWPGLSLEDFRLRVSAMLRNSGSEPSSFIAAYEWAALFRNLKLSQDASQTELVFARFAVTAGGFESVSHYPVSGDDLDIALGSADFIAFRDKVGAVGGDIDISTVAFDLLDVLPALELLPQGDQVRFMVSDSFENDGYILYAAQDYEAALDSFRSAFEVRPTAGLSVAAAFQLLHLSRWDEVIFWADAAEECARSAGEIDVGLREQLCLAAFDRAIAHVMKGNREAAIGDLTKVQELWVEDLAKRTVHLLKPAMNESSQWELVAADSPLVDEARALSLDLQR